MIKVEEIGNTYNVKYNGRMFTVTISADPETYKLYKVLGLDVFEEDERTTLEKELTALGVRFRKNSSVKTLRHILNDSITERLNESE